MFVAPVLNYCCSTASSSRLLRPGTSIIRSLRTKRNGFSNKKSFDGPPSDISAVSRSDLLASQRHYKDLLRPLAYTVGFSAACYVGSVIWQHERYSKFASAKNLANLFAPAQERALGWRTQINRLWNETSPGQKTVFTIAAMNTVVFGLWRLPSCRRLMLKYFTANPFAKTQCVPMTLSTFSHSGVFHLAINMYVLYSFSGPVVDRFMGVEQFWAFYLTAGTVASLASHFHKVATITATFSLGASGAILGVLGYACMNLPDERLHIIFLPMFTFSAVQGVIGILAFDAIGLALGWRMLDHAAHLGGCLFGVWYAKYGQKYFWDWKKRQQIVDTWLSVKGKKPPSL